jgi:hypothetical protein
MGELQANQYRRFTAFIIQVIGAADPAAAVGAFGGDWSMLLSSYIYPDDPFGEDDLILRDALNYLLYSCLSSVADSRISVLNAMAVCLRDKQNSECIFHFLSILIQFVREAGTLPFSSRLIRSQLWPILLTLSHSMLPVFDLVRVIIFKCPADCLTQPDCIEMLSASFFESQKRQSVVACLTRGLS